MMLTAAELLARVAPAAAQPAGLPRVAFLSIAFGSEEPVFDVFSDELRALGQIEGKTFRFELHVAPDNRSVPAVAEAMVRSEPAVVALHSGAGEALHRLTQTIPIVVVNSGDPLALGWSTSLARPSGNVTGVLNLGAALAGKRPEILRELVPAARRVGVLYQSDGSEQAVMLANTMAAAQGTDVTIVRFGLAEAGDLTEMLVRIAAARLDGLIVMPNAYLGGHRREIIESALVSRLPTMHAFAFEAQAGGLAAYGMNPVENFQRAAQYVDRLLGGAKIADLPFDAPRGVTLTIKSAHRARHRVGDPALAARPRRRGDRMKRRDFVTLLVGAAVGWPFVASAQQAGKVYRIGILETRPAAQNADNFNALRKGLRDLGYVEGQNRVIEYRSSEGRAERFPDLASELVSLKVDLIVTRGVACRQGGQKRHWNHPSDYGGDGRTACRRYQLRAPGWQYYGADDLHRRVDRETGRAPQRAHSRPVASCVAS